MTKAEQKDAKRHRVEARRNCRALVATIHRTAKPTQTELAKLALRVGMFARWHGQRQESIRAIVREWLTAQNIEAADLEGIVAKVYELTSGQFTASGSVHRMTESNALEHMENQERRFGYDQD